MAGGTGGSVKGTSVGNKKKAGRPSPMPKKKKPVKKVAAKKSSDKWLKDS